MTGSITKIMLRGDLHFVKGVLRFSFSKVTKFGGTLGTLELCLIINDLAGTLRGTYGTLHASVGAIASLTNQFPIDKSKKLDYALSQSITKKTECHRDTLSTQ